MASLPIPGVHLESVVGSKDRYKSPHKVGCPVILDSEMWLYEILWDVVGNWVFSVK